MDVEALAIQAGLEPILGCLRDGDGMYIECAVYSGLEEFARLVAIAEREECSNIDPSGLNIQASDMPHTVWAKYRGAILARSNAQADAPPLGGRGPAQS